MTGEAVLTTDWNGVKSLDDFFRQWPLFSSDYGIGSLSDIAVRPSCDSRISDLDDINGVIGYRDLSGSYVSQLETAYALLRNDLFLLSQKRRLPRSSAFSTTSRKIKYKDLSCQLFYDIFSGIGAGSMAYREKYEYAVSSHCHDRLYSRVNMSINPMYVKGAAAYVGDDNALDVCSCWISTDCLTCGHPGGYSSVTCNPAHATTDVRTFVWKVPKIKLPIPPRPMIGTVRFVGAPTLRKLVEQNALTLGGAQVNPYGADGKIRPDYDGWVFPNGARMENKGMALSAAAMIYSGSSSSDFTVPEFSQFFRVNAGGRHSMDVQPAQVGLKQHVHRVGVHNFNGTITLNKNLTEMYSTNGYGGGVYVHDGDKSQSETKAIVSTQAELDLASSEFTGLKTTECAAQGASEDPYPKHQLVPVMVYIGGETTEYYESLYDKYHSG